MGVETSISICGKEYPIARFMDQGEMKPFPYMKYKGKDTPIIQAASVIIEKDRKYLMVEEVDKNMGYRDDNGKFNFPGGMIEDGETFEDGALREVREETPFDAELTGFHGIYLGLNQRGRLIFKTVYSGKIIRKDNDRKQQRDVKKYGFYSENEIMNMLEKGMLKTKRILPILDAYLSEIKYPFDTINSPDVLTELPPEERKHIAYAVIINEKNDFLLRYDPLSDLWNFPGGVVESDDVDLGHIASDLEKTVKEQIGCSARIKRVYERLNIAINNKIMGITTRSPLLADTQYIEDDGESYTQRLFWARLSDKKTEISDDKNKLRWMNGSDLLNVNLTPEVIRFIKKLSNGDGIFYTSISDNLQYKLLRVVMEFASMKRTG